MMPIAKSLLRPLFSRLPQGVQHAIRGRQHARMNIAAVRQGHRLVPEAALEAQYRAAFRFLTAGRHPGAAVGDYLEFGVYNGSSMACAYRALADLGVNEVRLFGFDSFAGLPAEASTDDGGHWSPGDFRMDARFTRRFLAAQGIANGQVTLVPGWFSDTLNDAVIQTHALRKASVIMVDCDLYSSTVTVLAFCAPLIQDRAILFFDDWFPLADRNLGERRAFDEFLTAHPEFTAEEWSDYGSYSKGFLLSRLALLLEPFLDVADLFSLEALFLGLASMPVPV